MTECEHSLLDNLLDLKDFVFNLEKILNNTIDLFLWSDFGSTAPEEGVEVSHVQCDLVYSITPARPQLVLLQY
ncbi:hypothetical protein SULI_12885 [Saccharolobus solfataricus]|uniref:Uncharacterized protein n=1 Tax=Saccharolobus solfataricus TaxID=2287 RepID=A0A0E3MB66_SACSO|nr:hypothetical protein SULB_2542 [Saccharolobus solfataricus]AKA77359.1 hypothetical protein SULC_2537 [Saccharolobus solfataricus]AKA80050.1 hypothetical protein SULA_2539 [Saccharolobus solfataricus]AZF69129.1 hypothetical protein SULG_12885 [Saccharolobus solfataricus]AZF71749.1 hypothetical protein SULH_12885 [Saccharolobus solfataricus]